jgi:hypothetical protein
MKILKFGLYMAMAVVMLASVSSARQSAPKPIAAAGEHVKLEVPNLAGSSHPVVLEIIQGKQEDFTDEHPVTAKVCVAEAAPENCYAAEGSQEHFFTVVKADSLEIAPGKAGLLLWTVEERPNETWTLVSMLVIGIGKEGKLANALPETVLTMQDASQWWTDKQASPYPLITVASLRSDPGTTHTGRHRYKVETFEYDPEQNRYVTADKFTTKRSYAGLDDVDDPGAEVMKAVLPAVKARMGKVASS